MSCSLARTTAARYDSGRGRAASSSPDAPARMASGSAAWRQRSRRPPSRADARRARGVEDGPRCALGCMGHTAYGPRRAQSGTARPTRWRCQSAVPTDSRGDRGAPVPAGPERLRLRSRSTGSWPRSPTRLRDPAPSPLRTPTSSAAWARRSPPSCATPATAPGAVRAEAEGQAAALRARAELEADDIRKAAEGEAEAVQAPWPRSRPTRPPGRAERRCGRGRDRCRPDAPAAERRRDAGRRRPAPSRRAGRRDPGRGRPRGGRQARAGRARGPAAGRRDHGRGRRSGPRPSATASSPPTCGCWPPATTCSRRSTGWRPTSGVHDDDPVADRPMTPDEVRPLVDPTASAAPRCTGRARCPPAPSRPSATRRRRHRPRLGRARPSSRPPAGPAPAIRCCAWSEPRWDAPPRARPRRRPGRRRRRPRASAS